MSRYVVLAMATACGGKVVCGEGTTLVDDACVPIVVENQPPAFLSLATNAVRITETDLLRFSVVVTDPDGIEDVVGGTLTSPEGSAYATFQAEASEGAYAAALTWAELHLASPIAFEGEQARTFVATFFDQDGASVSQEVVVTLYCDTGHACEGTCLDVSSDELNCGACGRVCPDARPVQDSHWHSRCTLGRCAVKTDCITSRNATCEQACAANGWVCDEENGGYYGDVVGYTVSTGDPTCDYHDADSFDTCTETLRSIGGDSFASGYCYCWD